MQEIDGVREYALKYNLTMDVARERLLDDQIGKALVKQGKRFTFESDDVDHYLGTNDRETKVRIRYIIKHSMGELNYYFRQHYLKGRKDINWKKEIRSHYDRAKIELGPLTYSLPDYREKVYTIFRHFLDDCYNVFERTLLNIDSKAIPQRGNILSFFRKSELAKMQDELASPSKVIRTKEQIEREWKGEWKQMGPAFEDSALDSSYDPNSESSIMRAIQNGEGDLYGLG